MRILTVLRVRGWFLPSAERSIRTRATNGDPRLRKGGIVDQAGIPVVAAGFLH